MSINLKGIVSKNKVLNKIDNVVDNWLGKNTDGTYPGGKSPIYSVPLNLTEQDQATYVVITIYDNNRNNITFLPMEAQKVSSDILKSLKDTVSIKFNNEWKSKLKDYQKDIESYMQGFIEKQLGISVKDIKSTINNYIDDIKDSIKSVSDWIERNINLSSLAKVMNIDDWFVGMSSPIDINIDKEKLSNIAKKAINETSQKYLGVDVINGRSELLSKGILDPSEKGFKPVYSVALSLPIDNITYESQMGISDTETKTARAISSLFDEVNKTYKHARDDESKNKMVSAYESLVAGGKQAGALVGGGGLEALYSLLGEGGTALYQNSTRNIRDPMYVFMYNAPKSREMTFRYKWAPTSKDELFNIYNTIKILRLYSAVEPGINVNDGIRYYNLPARFRLTFYTGENENKWLFKTKLMGISNIKTNIPLESYAFIANEFDDSGNPPRVIELDISFKELSVLTREDINGGY